MSELRKKEWVSASIFAGMSLVLSAGCEPKSCPAVQEQEVSQAVKCEAPEMLSSPPYERWSPESGLVHAYYGGLSFDVGEPLSSRYMERKGASPWLDADYVDAEKASADNLDWASERYLRWLGAASGTFHFPFYPEDWEGNVQVEVGLRPKMNASMAVRFYRPDGNGGRVWSEPLTTDLTPGWHGYRWNVPREYLSKDGMQLMRVSFPGTFFEGENRVAAKFVHIGVGASDEPTGKFKLEKKDVKGRTGGNRVLDASLDGWGLRAGQRLERFMVVPEKARLRFYSAPGAWLETEGSLVLEVMTQSEKKRVSEIGIKPGACWELQDIDLSAYEGMAVRIVMSFEPKEKEEAFAPPREYRADVYLSSPEVRVEDGGLEKAREGLKNPSRIVVLAVDNLRADRLWKENKQRAVPNLSRVADEGVLGVVMGDGRSFVTMETSFLTGVRASEHGVREPGTHVRTSLTTIAEKLSPNGWKNYFYSTSGIIDDSHGYAQGFDTIRTLNKENLTDSSLALHEVSSDIASSPEKSFFYVHLSELRLPHRYDSETFSAWSLPGYSGGVNEAAMNNIAVLRDPTPQDSMQFEAYYDAELARVDAAIGAFIKGLPENTDVVLYGTHGCSLGESTLGYEQGLTPWELYMPYIFYRAGLSGGVKRREVVTADEISGSVLELAGVETEKPGVFVVHDSRPVADGYGMTAAGTVNWFYRIRREGVDGVFSTGSGSDIAARDEGEHSILKQAMREKID